MKKVTTLLATLILAFSAAGQAQVGPQADVMQTVENFCTDCFVKYDLNRIALYVQPDLMEWMDRCFITAIADTDYSLADITSKVRSLNLLYEIRATSEMNDGTNNVFVHVYPQGDERNTATYKLTMTPKDGKWLISDYSATFATPQAEDNMCIIMPY